MVLVFHTINYYQYIFLFCHRGTVNLMYIYMYVASYMIMRTDIAKSVHIKTKTNAIHDCVCDI